MAKKISRLTGVQNEINFRFAHTPLQGSQFSLAFFVVILTSSGFFMALPDLFLAFFPQPNWRDDQKKEGDWHDNGEI